MSLFGGDSSAPPTESEYDSGTDNSPPTITQSPPHASLRSPPDAQIPNETLDTHAPATTDADQNLAGDDADSEESDDEERPNRFKGPPQTWKGYTAPDRQIAESLQYFEDIDLAAHLYNAHALKRRVRKPAAALSKLERWQNKDAWLKQGQELQYKDTVGQEQTELVPTKDWTAWPLPPTSLYTLDEGFRRAAIVAEGDEWVIGGDGTHDAVKELEDEMLGLFLRLAKDNWNAKEWQDVRQFGSAKAQKLTKTRQKGVQLDVKMQDGSNHEARHNEVDTQDKRLKPGRKPQVESDVKPTVLADDAKAQALLRPTIASMLTKLDNLALGLQRTRLNHLGHGVFGETSSQSEFTTDAEGTERDSRSRSQSRVKSAPRSKPTTRPSTRPTSSRGSRAPLKPSRSTRQSEDSDSASDYGAQFEKEKSLGSNSSQSPTVRRRRKRSVSTADEEDASNTRDWSRAGLMDWSEVLGIAAVEGWDQKALARTAERCAALFGETPPSIAGAPRPAKRPYWQAGAIHCPHPDCYGHNQEFRVSYRVIEHCMRNHGYDPRTNDSDNEERTHGGVHIDGFMQPITAKQGWLGHGRSKAGGKRRRTEEFESVPAAESREEM
ncbi:hypothetical protein B5807_08099 [Epicoccum nigrum]|uniref:Rrn9 domain-containing protein n=1 Tax=Epicoccum nigrum TaxID=105696 RepID=A0A1Y2LQ43_EPING|nr:hypothetical protein B5807_08099 [Epicoccum nigrum]